MSSCSMLMDRVETSSLEIESASHSMIYPASTTRCCSTLHETSFAKSESECETVLLNSSHYVGWIEIVYLSLKHSSAKRQAYNSAHVLY